MRSTAYWKPTAEQRPPTVPPAARRGADREAYGATRRLPANTARLVATARPAGLSDEVFSNSAWPVAGFCQAIVVDPPPSRLSAFLTRYSRVVKLELVCRDDEMQLFVEIIRARAHTGKSGDGRIFVSSVEEAVNIRTGQTGEPAL